MTLESRISLRGRCGFRNKEKGQGGLFLPNQLGSGNMTCSPAALLARCPLAYLGLSFQLTGPVLWDTPTTLPPQDQDPIPGPLLTPSRRKKTSSLQILSLILHRAIHLEVLPAMSHLERIILSLRGLSPPKRPSSLVTETHLEPALRHRNQKCLQKQNNFMVMLITMRIKTHLHKLHQSAELRY